MIKFGKQGKEIVISGKDIMKGMVIINVLVMVMRIVMAIVAQRPVVEEIFDGTGVGTFFLTITLWLLYSEEDSKKEKQDEE